MGLRVQDDSSWRSFAELLTHLRMPLFTFLSGFVYAYRPIRPSQERHSPKKLLRLWVPLMTVSTVYLLLQQVAPDVNWRRPWSEMWRIYFVPMRTSGFFRLSYDLRARRWAGSFRGHAEILRLFIVLAGALVLHFFVVIYPSIYSSNQAALSAAVLHRGLGRKSFPVPRCNGRRSNMFVWLSSWC